MLRAACAWLVRKRARRYTPSIRGNVYIMHGQSFCYRQSLSHDPGLVDVHLPQRGPLPSYADIMHGPYPNYAQTTPSLHNMRFHPLVEGAGPPTR